MQPLPDASSSAMQRSGYPVGYAASLIAGIATPTEAAVLGVIAVIVVGGFLYRELSVATFARQTLSTLRTVGSVFIIIAAAAARSCPA